MRLTLKYDPSLSRATHAVYIRGAVPAVWLHEIAGLGVAPDRLACYVVPESIKSIAAAGLLVTFSGNVQVPAHLPAYSLEAQRLYLPAQSQLYPPVTEEELSKILLWDVQFFHPTIGLVGFEKADRLDLQKLISYQSPGTMGWDLAAAGPAPIPLLERVSVEPLDDDIMSLFEKGLDKKSLSDIPKAPGDKSNLSTLDKLKRDAVYHSLKSGLFLRDVIARFMSGNDGAQNGGGQGMGEASPLFLAIFGVIGLLLWPFVKGAQAVNDWANKSLEQLEKERNDEIKRLLDMLDDDPSEALKYAIPLSSYHESRGQSEPGSKLTARDTNFNLGSLGGGRSADVWNIGNRYNDLRAKYLKAAAKEIERKDFKKAAYIYAHLLGDFTLAANVLMQGHMYREAAVLYKEHLKNIPAAAECLEKGGLLNDAIDLYVELGKDEKVADLYMQLNDRKTAGKFYLQAADKYLAANDYLETARIYEDKMDMTIRASAALLKGWGSNIQPEACLKKYFDLVAHRTPDALTPSIRSVYTFNMRPGMNRYFLNALLHVHRNNEVEDVRQITTGIAYEMISEQISKGDLSSMFMLNSFVEQDKMLNNDLSRFVHKERSAPTVRRSTGKIQLRKDVKWEKVYDFHNQLFALGFQKDHMYFARANWYGDVDNVVWTEYILHRRFFLISSAYNKETVILYSQGENSSSSKYLPRNKYFNESINIEYTSWIPVDTVAMAINANSEAVILRYLDGALTLSWFGLNGSLKKTTDCYINGELIESLSSMAAPPEMVFRMKHYFTLMFGTMLAISEQGDTEIYHTDSPILRFAVSYKLDKAAFLIYRENCVSSVCFTYFDGDARTVPASKDLASYKSELHGKFASENWSIPITDSLIDMIFLPGDHIAIAAPNEVEIFSLEFGQPKSKGRFKTNDKIVGLVTITKRNGCAVLLQNGIVEVFEF